MLRVLMVLEDYGELMFLQTVLKKIGFDVDAIQNPRIFQDSLLRMNPEILVMTAAGKRVNGRELAKTVKRVRGFPKVVLIRAPNSPVEDDPEISAWLNGPVAAPELLKALSDLCNLDNHILQEKFQKLQLQDPEVESARVLKSTDGAAPTLDRSNKDVGNFGVLNPSTMSADERKKRYQDFLTEEKPEDHGFAIKKVQQQVKTLREEEGQKDLADLERQRKAFVEELFKKKS